MQPICDFSAHTPPVLTEKMLRAEWERRQQRRAVRIVTGAIVLALLCLLVLAVRLYVVAPALSRACLLYICVCGVCTAAAVLILAHQRREYKR